MKRTLLCLLILLGCAWQSTGQSHYPYRDSLYYESGKFHNNYVFTFKYQYTPLILPYMYTNGCGYDVVYATFRSKFPKGSNKKTDNITFKWLESTDSGRHWHIKRDPITGDTINYEQLPLQHNNPSSGLRTHAYRRIASHVNIIDTSNILLVYYPSATYQYQAQQAVYMLPELIGSSRLRVSAHLEGPFEQTAMCNAFYSTSTFFGGTLVRGDTNHSFANDGYTFPIDTFSCGVQVLTQFFEWDFIGKGFDTTALVGNSNPDGSYNSYPYIMIGAQQWMMTNLNAITYEGTQRIPPITSTVQFNKINYPCYWTFDSVQVNYVQPYGLLYNSFVITQNPDSNACPGQWHVATELDWKTLFAYVNRNSGSADSSAYYLKTYGWLYGAKSRNAYNFSAYPIGEISAGKYNGKGKLASWWYAGANGRAAGVVYMNSVNNSAFFIPMNNTMLNEGHSIRCVHNYNSH